MTINACVKTKRSNSLPKNPSLVALLFKDEGGLANHPLSCHPQGVFSRRESARKGEKIRESKIGGRAGSFSSQNLFHKVMIVCTEP